MAHVGADGPHGDAHIGLGHCRRIINPITHHGHSPPLGLQPGDGLGLMFRQDPAWKESMPTASATARAVPGCRR